MMAHTPRIKETTVWYKYAELSECALTPKGYFNLLIIPNLYIGGAGPLISSWRKCIRSTQSAINYFIEMNHDYIGLVERNQRGIPLATLYKIGRYLNVLGCPDDLFYQLSRLDVRYYLLEGDGGRPNPVRLPLKPSQAKRLIPHLIPGDYPYLIPIKQTAQKEVFDELRKLGLRIVLKKYGSYTRFYVQSKTFWKFLSTFYTYKRQYKLRFPLAKIVPAWRRSGVNLLRGVVIPALQSDGGTWYFHNRSRYFHDIVADAVYFSLGKYPTSYCIRQKKQEDTLTTSYTGQLSPSEKESLSRLGNAIKCSPARNQTAKEFLKENQPNLNYLSSSNAATKKVAMRIFMSAEGYVTYSKHKDKKIRPLVGLSCANPTLHEDLRKLGKQLEIVFTSVRKGKTWSGYRELISTGVRSTLNFVEIGGFLPRVYISGPIFDGLPKQDVLLAIFEYRLMESNGNVPRDLPRSEINATIRQIAIRRRFHHISAYDETIRG